MICHFVPYTSQTALPPPPAPRSSWVWSREKVWLGFLYSLLHVSVGRKGLKPVVSKPVSTEGAVSCLGGAGPWEPSISKWWYQCSMFPVTLSCNSNRSPFSILREWSRNMVWRPSRPSQDLLHRTKAIGHGLDFQRGRRMGDRDSLSFISFVRSIHLQGFAPPKLAVLKSSE